MDATPLIASVSFYGLVFAACELGRRLAKATIDQTRLLTFAIEFLGTLQVCAMAFENGTVLKFYGLPGFFLAIFGSVVVHMLTLHDVYANPCAIFEEPLHHRQSRVLNRQLIRLIAELIAGVVAFNLAKLIWGLGLMPHHSHLATGFHCTNTLNVPVLHGALYEGAATFITRLIMLKSENKGSRQSMIITALLVPTIVLLGLTTTGMFFNPIIASSINYRCHGVTPLEHTLVYWLGPIIGWILGTEVHNRTQ